MSSAVESFVVFAPPPATHSILKRFNEQVQVPSELVSEFFILNYNFLINFYFYFLMYLVMNVGK